jgi:FkbM family methyltransferase
VALPSVSLPNGMIVSCLQRHDVAIVNREVQGYFSHGLRLKPGDTVFDVGANIGLFTLAAYERCEHLRVYAFEPVRDIFDVLCVNVSRLAPADQLKVFDFGLASSAGTVRFAYYPRAPVLSTAYPAPQADIEVLKEAVLNNIMHLDEAPLAVRCLWWLPHFLRAAVVRAALKRVLRAKSVTCHMKTLSQVVRDHCVDKIDLLKIDVEKAELDILRGVEDPDWPKIKKIVIDVHDFDGRLETVTQLLLEQGLTRITVEQPVTLRGSSVYTVFAARAP